MKTAYYRKPIFILAFICSLLYSAMGLRAQSAGSVAGRVTDAQTGGGLPAVSIALRGTGKGTISTGEGYFELRDIPTGAYRLDISCVGYEPAERAITIAEGRQTTVNISLQSRNVSLEETVIEADRPYSAASSKSIRNLDLTIRPTRSAQDMLQLVPGLFIAQHAGGGKAEQIFMRGFDADHGTDVAVSVDGIPVNMVSHGHGQGYADLHFLIPETVEAIEVLKGPYFPRFGNLATAGAVEFETKEHVDNLVRVEAGAFNTKKLTTLFQLPSGNDHQNAYVAGQFYSTDGPVESAQGFERFNLFGKFHTHFSEMGKLTFSVGTFGSAWNASGQLPLRAVAGGSINRFGSIDDLEGGVTGRQNISMTYSNGDHSGEDFFIQTFYSRYDFKLFSDFTFFLNDPVNGDMIEQTDNRNILGVNSRYRFFLPISDSISGRTTLGGGFRSDDIDNSLWHSPNRVRLTQKNGSHIVERNIFLWAQEEIFFSSFLQVQFGIRGDYFTFDVSDQLERSVGNVDTTLPHASGYMQESIISPKINIVLTPAHFLDIYLNAGSGFHSNDARDVVVSRKIADQIHAMQRTGLTGEQIDDELERQHFDPSQHGTKTLPRAIGAELGFRTNLSNGSTFSVAGWWLGMEEELVFAGDEGVTEISGATRRFGVDFEGRMQILPWLWADADITLSKGILVDAPEGENDIPLAPRLTSTGGLTARHPVGLEAGLRYRHIGDRPANETNTVTAAGYTVFTASAAYTLGRFTLSAYLENIFDTEWNEAQFNTESRLRGEIDSVSEIHFTPGNPRNFQVGVAYRF